MGNKSLKIALKNDRVEQVEAMMIRISGAINSNLCLLGKDIQAVRNSQELAHDLFYDELMARTLKGRFKALVKCLGGKK